MKKNLKDKSNERILEALKQLDKVMEKEGRGYIFTPVIQLEGNHYSFVTIKARNMIYFWATLSAIVKAFSDNCPEEEREEMAECFAAFVNQVASECFPVSIKVRFSKEIINK